MTQELGTFAALGIHPNVLAAITAVGYEEPSPIQAQSIPVILAGHDMIGQAQTGTGKTAAFALPILSRIDPARREPQALILAPTRELALQVATAFETYAKQMPGLNVVAVYGGAPMGPQLKALRQGAQVIVATPGRLCDHLRRDDKMLSTVQQLVLDEADEMLKLGFMDDLEVIFEALPESRQSVLFSAPDLLVLDEAHLVSEPDLLKVARRANRWVLIGEPAWDAGSARLLAGLDDDVTGTFLARLVVETGHPELGRLEAPISGVRRPGRGGRG